MKGLRSASAMHGEEETYNVSVRMPVGMVEALDREAERRKLPTRTALIIALIHEGLHGISDEHRLEGLMQLCLRTQHVVEAVLARVVAGEPARTEEEEEEHERVVKALRAQVGRQSLEAAMRDKRLRDAG